MSASKWSARTMARPWRSPPESPVTVVSGVSTADVKPISSLMSPSVMRRISPTSQEPEAAGDGAAHEDVAPERQLLRQGALLEDGLDAEGAGLLHVQAVDPLAVERGSRPGPAGGRR